MTLRQNGMANEVDGYLRSITQRNQYTSNERY